MLTFNKAGALFAQALQALPWAPQGRDCRGQDTGAGAGAGGEGRVVQGLAQGRPVVGRTDGKGGGGGEGCRGVLLDYLITLLLSMMPLAVSSLLPLNVPSLLLANPISVLWLCRVAARAAVVAVGCAWVIVGQCTGGQAGTTPPTTHLRQPGTGTVPSHVQTDNTPKGRRRERKGRC